MTRTKWFDRKFPAISDNGLLPGILERLQGTPARLRTLVNGRHSTEITDGWTAAKEIGHLIDLEPLWRRRVDEISRDQSELCAADLTNRATHDTDHDRWPLNDLVGRFEPLRHDLVTALRGLSENDLEKSSRHPRLGTPMRVIDLAYFVAEHDDHHLARLRELLDT